LARQKIDILLVRKDAPVQTMRFGPWLLYLVLLLCCLTLAVLAAGGYMLYQQNQALQLLIKDNKRLGLACQNLESMLRDLQDRAYLSSQPEIATKPAEETKPPPKPSPEPQSAPPPPAETSQGEATAPKNGGVSASPQAQALEPWPTSCDWVEVLKIKTRKVGRELLVYFNVTNKKGPRQPAVGYICVILRGQRKGAPWLEAWPPTLLTPLGRPENPKKSAAFEVRRYRRLRARFALVDKLVENLEFLVYDKNGELALLMREPFPIKQRGS
jgi:hypothetical protein